MIFVCPFAAAVTAIRNAPASAIGGLWNTVPKVKLYQNNPAISSATVLADFVEADFSGYADISTGDVPFVVFDLELQSWVWRLTPENPGIVFTATAGAQTVNGVYVVNNAGDVLLGAGAFPTPIIFTKNYDTIDVGKIDFVWTDTPIG